MHWFKKKLLKTLQGRSLFNFSSLICYTDQNQMRFSTVTSPSPTGNSLVQIHKNGGGRSAGEGLSLQEGLRLYNGRKRKNQAGLQHLAPANKLPANAKSSHTSVP
uniref:Uncharacterized protein n=1 Tax=Panthera leo TaxID=9689 RepID=A0A8C8X0L2_PANLE